MVFAIIIVAVAALTVLISFIVYLLAFYNRKGKDMTYDVITGEDYDCYHDEMIALIDSVVGIEYEDVSIRAHDGKRLAGKLYYVNEKAPFHIMFHGYKGDGIRDFSGGLKLPLSMNENVLLIDERGHGKSDGHTISFGIKERYDVLDWIEFVRERFGRDVPIYLTGISMGAATVLMASDLDLPDNVVAITADCPYSSPIEILESVADGMVRFSKIVYPFFVIGAFLFGHFNVLDGSAEKSVKNAKVPILLIHGTGDHFVPFEMSKKIYNANPEKITFVSFEDAPHGLSYIKDEYKYKKAYYTFMAKTGKNLHNIPEELLNRYEIAKS